MEVFKKSRAKDLISKHGGVSRVAKLLNVSPATLYNYLSDDKNKKDITLNAVYRLSKILEVDLWELIDVDITFNESKPDESALIDDVKHLKSKIEYLEDILINALGDKADTKRGARSG